mgnify:CR=1 FL=1|tara:strand:+ start:1322 stop:1501 length:180 start_codon:yes stop_codon:yes gene_type:complete
MADIVDIGEEPQDSPAYIMDNLPKSGWTIELLNVMGTGLAKKDLLGKSDPFIRIGYVDV